MEKIILDLVNDFTIYDINHQHFQLKIFLPIFLSHEMALKLYETSIIVSIFVYKGSKILTHVFVTICCPVVFLLFILDY